MLATFEVLSGRADPCNDYIFHPTIKEVLDETSLDQLAVNK